MLIIVGNRMDMSLIKDLLDLWNLKIRWNYSNFFIMVCVILSEFVNVILSIK